MDFVCVQIESSVLPPIRLGRLRTTFSLSPLPRVGFSRQLSCVILRAGFALKDAEVLAEGSCLAVKNDNRGVTMHAKFGQPMPMSKMEKKSQDY